MTRTREPKRDVLALGIGGLVLVALSIAIMWIWLTPDAGAPESQSCSTVSQQGKVFADPRFARALLPKPNSALSFNWTADNRSAPRHQSTRLGWVDDDAGSGVPSTTAEPIAQGEYAELSLTPLVNEGRSHQFPDDHVSVYAQAGRDHIEVFVCVDARDQPPGVYTTTISFTDEQIQAAPIGASVTVTHGDPRVPFTLFIIGAFLAFVLVLVRAWGTNRIPIAGLLVAAVLALAAALSPGGPMDATTMPAWGSKGGDFITLVVATLLAVFGAGALGEYLVEVKASNRAPDAGAEARVGPDAGAEARVGPDAGADDDEGGPG